MTARGAEGDLLADHARGPAVAARVAATLCQGIAAALVHAAIDAGARAALGGRVPRLPDAWAIAASAQGIALSVTVLALLVARLVTGQSRHAAAVVLALLWLVPACWLAAQLSAGAWIASHPLRYAIYAAAVVSAPCAGLLLARDASARRSGKGGSGREAVLWAAAGVAFALADAGLLRGTYAPLHRAAWIAGGYCWLQVARTTSTRWSPFARFGGLANVLLGAVPGAVLALGIIDAATGSALELGGPPPAFRNNAEQVLISELERLARRGPDPSLDRLLASPRPSRPRVRGVLLVIVDTLRADVVEIATATEESAAAAQVPFLRELRGRSLRFTSAYTPIPTTRKALPNLFHSMHRFDIDVDPRRHLASVLAAGGVRSEAVLWDWFARHDLVPPPSMSLRGFATTEDYASTRQEEAVPRTMAMLRAGDQTERRFSWLHLACMHDPGFDGSLITRTIPRRARYARSLAWLDGQLRELFVALAAAGPTRDLAVIVTADHGEGLGDHGNDAHGDAIWEEQVRVPLWIVAPGVVPADDPTLSSLVDLPPTIAALLDVDPHPAWEGVDVFAPRSERLLELVNALDTVYALTDGRHKIASWRGAQHVTYYDLVTDPKEENPLDPGVSEASRRLLRELVARTPGAFAPHVMTERGRRALAAIDEAALDARSAEMIRALRRHAVH